jgi:hypothetical protein
MDYHIVFSPELDISPEDFATAWNEMPECRKEAEARQAAESITAYGEKLFNQVFTDRQAYVRYMGALQAGVETLAFEVAGAPDFHRFHWEAIKDPDLPQPMALQSPMINTLN